MTTYKNVRATLAGTSDTLMYLASEKNVECIYYQHWLSVVLFGTENSYWHNNVEPKHLPTINFTCLPKVIFWQNHWLITQNMYG